MKRTTIFITVAILIMTEVVNAQTWTPLSVGSAGEVYFMSFPSDDTGYVSIGTASLKKTSDAGANWSTCNVPPNPFEKIDFVTGQRGFMVQTHGVSMTTDGAQTWNTVVTDPALDFYDVYFVTPTVGFASATNYDLDTAYVYTTTNGGATWNVLPAITGHFFPFTEIYFTTPLIGFLAADMEFLKTTDGGVTWNNVYTDPNSDTWCTMYSPDGINIFGGGWLGWFYTTANSGSTWAANSQLNYPGYGIYFNSPLHGFYCGGNGFGSGAIEETNNGGATWNSVYTGNTLWCMDFPSPSRGYAAGTNGVIVRYDGGPQSTIENSLSQVSIYPNPATDCITIENVEIGSVITITNSLGQVVKTETAADSRMRIDVSDLESGIYICGIVENKTRHVQRISIQ